MFSFLIGTEEAKHELNYISINKERITESERKN